MHMHMFPASNNSILKVDMAHLANALWERLEPDRWPLSVKDLPAGSALVGGAVRDGLLQRLAIKPDFALFPIARNEPDFFQP